MSKRIGFGDMSEKVMLFESIVFERPPFLHIDGLNPDNRDYDYVEGQSIRKKELMNVYIVQALLSQKDLASKSYNFLCKIEEELFSANFYSEIVLGKSTHHKLLLRKFLEHLSFDINLLKQLGHSLDYGAAVREPGYLEAPANLMALIQCLVRMEQDFSVLETS